MEALLINAAKVQIREDVWRTKSCMERTPVQLFSVGGGGWGGPASGWWNIHHQRGRNGSDGRKRLFSGPKRTSEPS